jgi:hypothetical protein
MSFFILYLQIAGVFSFAVVIVLVCTSYFGTTKKRWTAQRHTEWQRQLHAEYLRRQARETDYISHT